MRERLNHDYFGYKARHYLSDPPSSYSDKLHSGNNSNIHLHLVCCFVLHHHEDTQVLQLDYGLMDHCSYGDANLGDGKRFFVFNGLDLRHFLTRHLGCLQI